MCRRANSDTATARARRASLGLSIVLLPTTPGVRISQPDIVMIIEKLLHQYNRLAV